MHHTDKYDRMYRGLLKWNLAIANWKTKCIHIMKNSMKAKLNEALRKTLRVGVFSYGEQTFGFCSFNL